MFVHYYENTNLDINKIAEGLADLYKREHFEVQYRVDQSYGFVQLKKLGMVRTLTGFDKAITIRMQQQPGGLRAQISFEDWVSKLAVESIIVLFVATLGETPAIIGSIDEVHLAHKVIDDADYLVREQALGIDIVHHDSCKQ